MFNHRRPCFLIIWRSFSHPLRAGKEKKVRTILWHDSNLGSPVRPSSLQRTLSWLEIQTNKILFYRESTVSGALLMKQYGGKQNTLRSQSSPMGKAIGLSDNQEQHKFIYSPPTYTLYLLFSCFAHQNGDKPWRLVTGQRCSVPC